ncbi:MAG: hypothetical protein ACRDZQ_06635 [Acidimicrobiales bacterium]
MASGIVSVGADLLGRPVLSQVALTVTILAFVVLVPAYAARAARFPGRFREGLRDPTTAMAYFTLVAGADVLAIRVVMGGHPLVALGSGRPPPWCGWCSVTACLGRSWRPRTAPCWAS